ncbi:MAG: anti-sigma factor family protein [Myxococcota bacterium]
MMTCREFVDFLMAYDDGELPESQRSLFEQHMTDCPPCVTYLETYRETARLGRLCRDPDGPVPEDAPEDLVRAVLAARKG